MTSLLKVQNVGSPSPLPTFLFDDDLAAPLYLISPQYLYQDFDGETPVENDGDTVALVRNFRRPVEVRKAFLPGVTGAYFSTPDSVAASITGDIDIRLDMSMPDWTPGEVKMLLSKWLTTANNRSYYLALDTTGSLYFGQNSTGSGGGTQFLATEPLGFAANERKWIRVTFDSDNGASGRTVAFYKSDDGSSWTQIGSSVTVATASGIYNSGASVMIGSYIDGSGFNAVGSVYEAQIRNGIGGSVVVSFKPDDYVDGSTWASVATGETWTMVGRTDVCAGESHLFQATEALRPVYHTDGVRHWLDFSGNKALRSGALDLSTYTVANVFAAVHKADDAASGILVEMSDDATASTGAFLVSVPENTTSRFGTLCRTGAGNTSGVTESDVFEGPQDFVLAATFNSNGATAADVCSLRVNGNPITLTSTVSNVPGTGNLSVYRLNVGARAGASNFFSGKLFALTVVPGSVTSSNVAATERCFATVAGIHNVIPTSFDDATTPVDAGDYYRTNQFASVSYETDATEISVTAWNNIYSFYDVFAAIGVYVDGAYSQSITQGASGFVTKQITLPAGAKTVTLVNGPQSRPSVANPQIGTYVVAVTANDPLTPVVVVPDNRLLVYGDSISAGDASSPVQQKAWTMQLRAAAYPNSIAMEGWGYRTLYEDCIDGAARTVFVDLVETYAPDTLWIAIGTNDYALNKWSAANFGIAYAATLDALHAALPDMQIYCQTPLTRVSETANTKGSTLPDYRTQIATIVSSRTSYCTLIDGTAILTIADLSDNVHPTTAGHTKYANYVRAVLGL